MTLLLDTHAIIWWLRDNPRLGRRARMAIADARSGVAISIASFWELSIKARIGKFDESGQRLMNEAEDEGFQILGISAAHLSALEHLERREGHNDPFDHLILAQAEAEKMSLITADRQMTGYGVRCINAHA